MPIQCRPLPQLTPQDIERFWSQVDKRGHDECWPWLAGVNAARDGYGRFWVKRIEYRTNRMAYWLHYGIDPGKEDACHSCDNPPCCNPSHLFKGTRAENLADMVGKGRSCRGNRHRSKVRPESIARGNRMPQAKLNPEKVREIRGRYAAGGISQNQLAKEYGVGQCSIWHVLKRSTWTHV